MKHYEQLIELGCFSRHTLAELMGNDASAASLIQCYLQKGYIERVRRDLYAVISLETKQPIFSRYQIGTSLFSDACISHHSAFEVFGYANQVFYETYVATQSRFADFSYNGISYHRIALRDATQIERVSGVRVTGLEQTVVDSICDFEKIGGLEETIRCLMLVPSLNEKKLLDALAQHENKFLYQKTGYLLQELNSALGLSDAFFAQCEENSANGKRYLTTTLSGLVWNQRWGLYVPASLRNLVDKGVAIYDAV